MPDTPNRPAGRTLAEFRDTDKYGPLYPAELALLNYAQQGEPCDLDEHHDPDVRNDPRVRASFIRFLALGGDEEAPVHEKGVWLFNAGIEGQLDLSQCKDVLPLKLDHCTLSADAPIMLQDAHLNLLSLQGSTVPGGIDADRATVEGNVFLRNSTKVTGAVRFLGAKIHGNLSAERSILQNADGPTLICDGAWISGSLALNANATITGEVRLLGAKIYGNVSAIGSTVDNTGDDALSCDGAWIGGHLDLRVNANILGTVRLLGAKIYGNVSAIGSTVDNTGGDALICDGAWIGKNIELGGKASITGEVRLVSANIDGNLTIVDSTLHNECGNALTCDRARVGGNVFLSDETAVTGSVRLPSARIEGAFYADNSKFNADSTEDGIALNAEHTVIEDKALLCEGFTSYGIIYFGGATVRRSLDLTGSTIDRPGAWAVDLQDIRVEGTLRLDSVRDEQTVAGRIDGDIDLRGANVAYVADRLAGTEPEHASGAIHLDQFRYERFVENSTLNVDARLRWLRFQPAHHQRGTADPPDGSAEPSGFRPQPYDQLAEVYRAMGHERDRHRVLYEKHQFSLRAEVFLDHETPWYVRVGAWAMNPLALAKLALFEAPVGYGHRVLPMFAMFFGLLGASYFVFDWAYHAGYMVPTDGRVLVQAAWQGACMKGWNGCNLDVLAWYPAFSPFSYALDILLPVVGLEQQTAWTPNWVWLNVLKWFNILYGWFTGLMLVAIVSGVVQRA